MNENINFTFKRVRAKARAHPWVGSSLRWLAAAHLRKALARHSDDEALAILILMPGSLHLGLLAIQHLTQLKNVIPIANGLCAQEIAIAEKTGNRNIITLGTPQSHHLIIDNLIRSLRKPFWMVDHDCYVFQSGIFHGSTNDHRPPAGRSVFAYHNDDMNALIPETFLMRLVPDKLKSVARHFGISSRSYAHHELPAHARHSLESLGWSAQNYPEPHKDYYDTLRVIALLSPKLGFTFETVPGYSPQCEIHNEVVHIGNTSNPEWVVDPSFYKAIGAYFWKLSLMEQDDVSNLDLYQKRSRSLPSLSQMRDQLIDSGCSPTLLDRLDRIAKKVNASASSSSVG